MQNIETAPRKPRHEIVRILMFLSLTLGVQAVAIGCEIAFLQLLFVFCDALGLAGDFLGVIVCTYLLIFVAVAPGIAAAFNRRFTFRAAGKRWPGPLLMAGLGILYAFLFLRVLDPDLMAPESSALIWKSMALWLILQYVLQRWVLYRKTLDTLP